MSAAPKSVIVVGAGIIGAAIAYRLAKTEARVTLIDMAGPSAGATGKSFGWVNANEPEPGFYNQFRQKALTAWERLGAELGLPLHRAGCLSWEHGDNALRAQADALSMLGHPSRIVNADEIAVLEPSLKTPPEIALYCEAEGAYDPDVVAPLLCDEAAKAGAERRFGITVTGLKRIGSRVAGVETDFGPIDADMVILAAGLGASVLVNAPDWVVDNPGLLIRTTPSPAISKRVFAVPGMEFRQEADGRFHIATGKRVTDGGSESASGDPAVIAKECVDALNELFPKADVSVADIVIGRRPVPKDGLPIIGEVEPGAYLAVMHSGATLAALAGEMIAAEIMGAPQDALAPYRPSRFR